MGIFFTEYSTIYSSYREADVLSLPSSGLDLIELENLHTTRRQDEDSPTLYGDDSGSIQESEGDYEDEEKPRKCVTQGDSPTYLPTKHFTTMHSPQ